MYKKGYTLIELLIVIAIIGVLVAVGSISYITALKQSRDTRRKTDLEQIRGALETYRSEMGIYPDTLTWENDLAGTYISIIPSDPTSNTYYYEAGASNTNYSLCATLESPSDPDFIGCIDATYNYEVNNP